MSRSSSLAFKKLRDAQRGRLNVHGAFQGLTCRGHHRWKLSRLKVGASFKVLPQAALHHGQKLFGAIANPSCPLQLLLPEGLQLRFVALKACLGSRLRHLLQKLCVVLVKPRFPVPLFRSPSQRRLRTTHSFRGLTELTSRSEVPMQEKLLIGLRRLAGTLGEGIHRSLFPSSGFQRASASFNALQFS